MNRSMSPALICFLLVTSAALAEQPAAGEKSEKAAPSREELEKQLSETLSGATLVGHFTIGDLKADQPLKEERYTLGKVAKLKNGDYWSFQARIQYGDHDVEVPLALEVKWAGDTPIVTLTDVAIPGLGTYTSRVIFYRNQYAGTWSGGTHGGHLFGKVVKNGDAKTGEKPSAP